MEKAGSATEYVLPTWTEEELEAAHKLQPDLALQWREMMDVFDGKARCASLSLPLCWLLNSLISMKWTVIVQAPYAIITVLSPFKPIPKLAGYSHLHQRPPCLFSIALEPAQKRKQHHDQSLKALSTRCLQGWLVP